MENSTTITGKKHDIDDIFTVSLDEANKVIEEAFADANTHPSLPRKFHQVEKSMGVGDVVLEGEFHAWQFSEAVAGKNLQMRLPIKNGKLTFRGAEKPINDHIAVISVRVEAVSQAAKSRDDPPSRLALKTNGPAVAVIGFEPKREDLLELAVTKTLVQDWLNSNVEEFDDVLSNVSRLIDPDLPVKQRPSEIATDAETDDDPVSIGAADTSGWDAVFAIPYSDVNKSIAKAFADTARYPDLPRTFHFQDSPTSQDNTVDGTFEPWQLKIGGAGQNLHMSLPIKTGKVRIMGKDVPIDNHTISIEVQAKFSPKEGATATKGTNELVLATSGDESADVSLLDVVPEIEDVTVRSVTKELLREWLKANVKDFSYVFATVDLAEDIAEAVEALQWLAPTAKNYGVTEPAQGATLDNSIFAVMTMTEGRINSKATHNVSPLCHPRGVSIGISDFTRPIRLQVLASRHRKSIRTRHNGARL